MAKLTSSKKLKTINSEMLKLSTFIELDEIPIEDFLETIRLTGKEVSEKEAREMLEILYALTRITIKEYFSPE
ncbi:hypothetical protein DRF65_10925 [Chryseobacterium pennae]|uniref:Uncharacterized protein n=1 Tax=Chryseobacterium pennae TaxID=2258962 RepID=A0A3D9C8Y5_9FLAO|nr:hypothetical protein [Chryseobacterium pennae]REC62219.1 hypothetical protein DRF65_10925 [Chryseobacterium pennae]